MSGQFNCLFESQIARGYAAHHLVGIVLLERNDETLSTVTLTTFGAVQTQFPSYSVRELIFTIPVNWLYCVFLLTAAGQVVLLKVPASVHNILLGMCVCLYVGVSKHLPIVGSTFTSGMWVRHTSRQIPKRRRDRKKYNYMKHTASFIS